ncbi:tetratricopeptide repeat protein [Leucobacter sp. gxy201]|uniref:tetratricopeptide repeat protein n=1 Tax=Leucobacter sp. gxy201 TaxID=2957200 RepID=UPI003DA0CBD2
MSDAAEPWDAVPGAVRGVKRVSERWLPVRELVNNGAMALNDGMVSRGMRLLRDAIAATEGVEQGDGAGRREATDDEAQRLDLRARAFANLAGAEEWQSDQRGALRSYDCALSAAEACVALAADDYGTRTVIANVYVSRAGTLSQLGRMDEAFASTSQAEALLDELGPAGGLASDEVVAQNLGVLRFQVHNIRSTLFIMTGRFEEAEAEANRAIAAAMAADPALAGHAYTNLGVIAQRTGDPARAEEYLRLSSELQSGAPAGDAASRQLAVANLARAAFGAGRFAEARERFTEAERLALDADLPMQAAAARTGVAAVLLKEGRVGKAVAELQRLAERLDRAGAAEQLREVHQFIGDAESMRGRYGRAEERYAIARELTRTVHERCRVDLRRAEMHAEWAGESPLLRSRVARLEQARDLAVPVLLATEALREGFVQGATRERWVAQVAAPARELAFRLAMTLHDAQLLGELVEHESATATLRSADSPPATAREPESPSPDLIGELLAFAPAEPDASGEDPPSELPLAAGHRAFFGGTADGVRFAAPPRVIAAPGGGPVLMRWAAVAEAEYGVRVYSDIAVASW